MLENIPEKENFAKEISTWLGDSRTHKHFTLIEHHLETGDVFLESNSPEVYIFQVSRHEDELYLFIYADE